MSDVDPIAVMRELVDETDGVLDVDVSARNKDALAKVEALVEAADAVTLYAHVGECAEHPDHLMGCENAIRKMQAALAPFPRKEQK